MKYVVLFFFSLGIFNMLYALDGVPFLGIVMKDNSTKVTAVTENSPAQKAGIQIDDTIISVNKEPVKTNSQLIMRVYSYNAGDTLTFEYLRNTKKKSVKIKLAERTDKYAYMFKNLPFVINQVQIMEMGNALLELGCVTDNLTEQLLTFFNVQNGIMIVHVESGTEAWKKGLKAGDIILSANNTEIRTTRDFRMILNKEQDMKLLIKRHRSNFTVTVKKKSQ